MITETIEPLMAVFTDVPAVEGPLKTQKTEMLCKNTQE